MGFDNFRFQIILRTTLLLATIILLSWLLLSTGYIFITILVFVIVILQVFSLIKYIERTNREIGKLFNAIEHADFTLIFPEDSSSSFNELYRSLNKVLDKFRVVRQKEEEQRHFLQNILHHITTALVIFDDDGHIIMINTAAKKLFATGRLKNIDQLPENFAPLKERLPDLVHHEKELIHIKSSRGDLHLSCYTSHIVKGGKLVRLLSLQNISNEMNESELEAWHKLIRVLTHEIMNSMTPITSLASSAKEILMQGKWEHEQHEDLRSAVGAIEKRSAGLTTFISTYRSLIKEVKPQFEYIKVKDIFTEVAELLNKEISARNIRLEILTDPSDLRITADPVLMEQVFINLLLNAIDAVAPVNDPVIHLQAFMNDESKAVLIVRDNGVGILEEVQSNIFIPFFSTKKQGSGIGLSLSKNIITAHGGSISVVSEFEQGTEFLIII